ncbi:MAG: hypothetical protein N2260_05205 [Syntrophobacterales bacterium]|nr:hypothetical protein [Syntrophobacterales bacterium]
MPSSLENYKSLIVMGGPMGVYEMEDYSHLKVVSRLIREAINRNLRVLGMCLGAQLIDYTFGARVYKGHGEEVGWFDKVPGELRIPSEEVFKTTVKKGIREGMSGLGRVEEGKPSCIYFKKECGVNLSGNEILIKKELCEEREPKDIDIKHDKIKPSSVIEAFGGTISKEESENKIKESFRQSEIVVEREIKIKWSHRF